MKEGNNVEIKCKPGVSNRPRTIWFRVRDNAGMEFMATYDLNGNQKKKSSTLQLDSSKITRDILILESFKREDSGFYCCAVIQGYSLEFGQVTQLVAGELNQDLIISLREAFQSSFKYICVFYLETIAAPQPTVAATTRETKCTTAAVCVCEEKGRRRKIGWFGFTKHRLKTFAANWWSTFTGKTVKGMSLDCAPLILGPLAGGCGLLLLLLIITSLYCNSRSQLF